MQILVGPMMIFPLVFSNFLKQYWILYANKVGTLELCKVAASYLDQSLESDDGRGCDGVRVHEGALRESAIAEVI